MIKFINEELFSFYLENCQNETYGEFVKLSIQSSRSIVKSEKGKGNVPNTRIFARLVSPDKDYLKYNLSVSTKYNENDNAQVLFKCSPDGKNDNLIYLIAFPFNGIIKPIPESSEYRILKGMISSSEQYSVVYEGKRYKKVLYLILSPKKSLFDNSPETVIPFSVESYSYYKDDAGEVSTVRETLNLDIYSDRSETEFISEEIEPLDLDIYRNKPIFTVYRRPEKTSGDRVTYNNNIRTKPNSFNKPYQASSSKPNFSKDSDDDYPKKKAGGNPNRKKKVRR